MNPTIIDPSVNRKPTRLLNYPREVLDAVGQIVGPNVMGEHWIAVSADYDGKNTRVGFAIATPTDPSHKEE